MTTPNDTALVAELNSALPQLIPVVSRMGLQIVAAQRGKVTTMAPFTGNGNHLGGMYAGVLFTVSEFLGGLIATTSFDTQLYYPVAKDFRITFRAPATSDVWASAELTEPELDRIATEAQSRGKADYTLASAITDVNGTVVASTEGLFQLRAHRR